VHLLVAADADHVIDAIIAALGGPDVSFTICRDGRAVTAAVQRQVPDLAVLDLQSGSMGAMAVTMALRLDESSGALPHVKVLMLLDRQADVHLAKRSDAEGWVVKPLDPFQLKRAAQAILHPPAPVDEPVDEPVEQAAEQPEEEPAAAG
jgi:CheY-like chemotaxis protein